MRAVKGNFRKYWKTYLMPYMTSDTTPSGTATLISGSGFGSDHDTPWQMFNASDSNAYFMPSSSSVTIRYTFPSNLPAGYGKITGMYSSDDPKGATTSQRALTYYKMVANYTDGTTETLGEWSGSTYAVTTISIKYNTSKTMESIDFIFNGSVWYTFGTLYDFNVEHNYQSTASDYDFITTQNFALPTKVERTYWKYKYIPWENPILSANGAMGGSEYACSANTTTGAAWQAFDGNTGTIAGVYWGTGGRPTLNLILYCPNPVKVTEAKLWWISDPAQSSSCFKDIYCYGSNDNETWVQIGQVANQCGLAGHWTTMDCSSNTEYYHYYKFTSTQSVGASYEDSNYFGEIKYSGEERIVEPATESDYDYYTDQKIIKAFGDK